MDLLAGLLALIAPPRCVACRVPGAHAAEVLCGECRGALPWLTGGRCPRCNLAAHAPSRCRTRGGGLSRTWAPMAYEGVARDLVHELKLRGRLPIAELMAAQLAANLPADLRRAAAVVVPVPAHPGRRRHRGHDPVDALAGGLARRARLPFERCLRRIDAAAPQRGATRAERLRSGRLHFAARGTRVPARVLLVDDVHTTGATLEACAAALRAAGCEWVGGVAYARAQ